jgi:hypothetical protein
MKDKKVVLEFDDPITHNGKTNMFIKNWQEAIGFKVLYCKHMSGVCNCICGDIYGGRIFGKRINGFDTDILLDELFFVDDKGEIGHFYSEISEELVSGIQPRLQEIYDEQIRVEVEANDGKEE